MEILIYGNRKQDDMMWDISTPEKKKAAFLLLFKYLKDEWGVYCDMSVKDKELYDRAIEGDAFSAEKLLTRRKTYEYEEWNYGLIINPLEG